MKTIEEIEVIDRLSRCKSLIRSAQIITEGTANDALCKAVILLDQFQELIRDATIIKPETLADEMTIEKIKHPWK